LKQKLTVLFIVAVFIISSGLPVFASDTPPLEGRIIVLDAGHGTGSDNVYEKYSEQAAMLSLARKIKPLLEELGATVHFTRSDAETVLLPKSAALINIWTLESVREARAQELETNDKAAGDIREINRLLDIMHRIVENPRTNGRTYMNFPFDPGTKIHPDLVKVFEFQKDLEVKNRYLVISLHSNSTPPPINTSVSGATAFYISNTHRNTRNYYTSYTYGDQSRLFGDILLNYIDETGINKREVAVENYFMIRELNVPSVLVENGFHTNARDREKLLDGAYLDKLALAYRNAIVDYFSGLPLPASVPVVAPALTPADTFSFSKYLDILRIFFNVFSLIP